MESTEDTSAEVVPASQVEVLQLEDYLKKVCPVLLDGDSTAFESVLKSAETTQKLRKFISDTKIPLLLVQKRVEVAEEEGVAAGTLYQSLCIIYVNNFENSSR